MEILRNDDDKVVRATAAEAIGILGLDHSLGDLKSILKTEENPMVRVYIQNAIEEIEE